MQGRLSLHSVHALRAVAFAGLAQAQTQTPEEFFPGTADVLDERGGAVHAALRRRRRFAGPRTRFYVDRETMAGADDWAPLPAAADAERTISAQALDGAERYAEINNSNAFIVWRNGKIERETYFGGHTRTSPINSFSLAKQVTAFAIGPGAHAQQHCVARISRWPIS